MDTETESDNLSVICILPIAHCYDSSCRAHSPQTLDELVGQQHLAGKGSILRTAIEHGHIPSMILWGPPGTGKTTIANIIANTSECSFFYTERHQLRCKRCKGSD